MVPFKPLLIALSLTATGAITTLADDASSAPSAATPPAERHHHIYLVGSLLISEPWIDMAGGDSDDPSAYLVVENRSSAPDRLTGASVAGAASVSLASPGAGTAVDSFEVPPNGTLTLKPDDMRLVLHGLTNRPPKGPPVDGTLHFERSGSVHVSFLTDRIGSLEPAPTTAQPKASLVQP